MKKSWFLDKNISFKSGKTTRYLNEKEIWNIWMEICKYDFSWYLRVYFIQTDETWNKKEFYYKIDLVTTKCNYWWVKWWFFYVLVNEIDVVFYIYKIIDFLQVEKLLTYVMKNKKKVESGDIFDIYFEIILQKFWK